MDHPNPYEPFGIGALGPADLLPALELRGSPDKRAERRAEHDSSGPDRDHGRAVEFRSVGIGALTHDFLSHEESGDAADQEAQEGAGDRMSLETLARFETGDRGSVE